MSEQRKAVIKNADMSDEMQQDAVDCASQALSKYNIEKVSDKDNLKIWKFKFEAQLCNSAVTLSWFEQPDCSINILVLELTLISNFMDKNDRRILQHILKKNLTKSITQHGE